MTEYQRLLEELPEINYNIMKKLICHLYAVHELHEKNLMPLLNLAPIWGPTLMNVDVSLTNVFAVSRILILRNNGTFIYRCDFLLSDFQTSTVIPNSWC